MSRTFWVLVVLIVYLVGISLVDFKNKCNNIKRASIQRSVSYEH